MEFRRRETENLVIRPFLEDDIPAIFRLSREKRLSISAQYIRISFSKGLELYFQNGAVAPNSLISL